MEEIRYLRMFDAVFALHKAFGDSEYIHNRLQICYERRLTKLSYYMEAAGTLLNSLRCANSDMRHHIIRDTVVRFTINDALRQIETETWHGLPLDKCEEIFLTIVQYLKNNEHEDILISEKARIHCLRPGIRIWTGEHFCGQLFEQTFQYAVQERCGGLSESSLELCIPNSDEISMISKGAMLLNELLPLLSRSALSHTHTIALFPSASWKSSASLSQFWLAGTIFLGKEFLSNPWWVAEHLLHESLHQKLYDFHHGHSLLIPNFSREDAPSVCSLWNVPGTNKANCWDTHRAVAAFHVYVHLALLSAMAEQRAAELEEVYGSPCARPAMIDSRKAMERAHYLGEKIEELCWQELGLAGKRLVKWLISVIDALDPSPPPKGCYTHLLLDRYQREAQSVRQKVDAFCLFQTRSDNRRSQSAIPESFMQKLLEIIKYEIENTRRILSGINASDKLIKFDHEVDSYSKDGLENKFYEIRNSVAAVILSLYDADYRPKNTQCKLNYVQNIVTQMVENSSENLHVILKE